MAVNIGLALFPGRWSLAAREHRGRSSHTRARDHFGAPVEVGRAIWRGSAPDDLTVSIDSLAGSIQLNNWNTDEICLRYICAREGQI